MNYLVSLYITILILIAIFKSVKGTIKSAHYAFLYMKMVRKQNI